MNDPFQGLRYFSRNSKVDHWGNPDKMSPIILNELDQFRHHLNTPGYVTSGYREKSEIDSEHTKGTAVDIIFPYFKGHLLDLFIEATRFHFVGIGLYRDWKYGEKSIGGLHLDMRSGPSARWLCYKNQAGVQQYEKLNFANLKFRGII